MVTVCSLIMIRGNCLRTCACISEVDKEEYLKLGVAQKTRIPWVTCSKQDAGNMLSGWRPGFILTYLEFYLLSPRLRQQNARAETVNLSKHRMQF